MLYCDKCGSGDCCERTDLENEPVLCDDCYDKEFKKALGLKKFNFEMTEIFNKLRK